MVRKLPNFVPSLFEALMNFLLDIEDDPDWHKVRVTRDRGWQHTGVVLGGCLGVVGLAATLPQQLHG
jgi:hypothetical protein